MGLTIKIPIKKIEGKSVCDQVEELFKEDNQNAYNVGGIMITKFGVKESEIHNKPFKDWKKGLPTMYSRIRNCLEKMVKGGRANKKKEGRADYYWLNTPNRLGRQ